MAVMLRVVLSFAMVGLLLWLFARASRGRLGTLLSGSIGGSKGNPLAVLDRCQLTKGSAVALVRAGERHLLLGVAEGRVELLAEGDDLAAADQGTMIDLAITPGDPRTDQLHTEGLAAEVSELLPTDLPGARTRPHGPPAPNPPRTSLIDALRERTVRRS